MTNFDMCTLVTEIAEIRFKYHEYVEKFSDPWFSQIWKKIEADFRSHLAAPEDPETSTTGTVITVVQVQVLKH